MAIIEPILAMLGPQITRWDQLGTVQSRTGNRSVNNAPRNAYRTADGSWVAVSTSAQSIAERVVALVGRPELAEEEWFASGATRAEHADLLEDAVAHGSPGTRGRRSSPRSRPLSEHMLHGGTGMRVHIDTHPFHSRTDSTRSLLKLCLLL